MMRPMQVGPPSPGRRPPAQGVNGGFGRFSGAEGPPGLMEGLSRVFDMTALARGAPGMMAPPAPGQAQTPGQKPVGAIDFSTILASILGGGAYGAR